MTDETSPSEPATAADAENKESSELQSSSRPDSVSPAGKDVQIMMYEREIEELKEQLAQALLASGTGTGTSTSASEGNEEMMPVAQVSQMILSVQEMDSKEREEYERRLEANKHLIEELGARVGQTTTDKAELELEKELTEKLVAEQAMQLARLQEMNIAQSDLLRSNHEGDTSGEFSKLKFLMDTNQKLITDLAQAQEDIQKIRRQVADKDLLCLELSNQLDRLANQLNTADEGMADVKNEATATQESLEKALERILMIEKMLLDAEDGDDTQGKPFLFQKLKEKEAQCKQLEKERNASIKKATQLALALAKTKEHADALQAKVDDQTTISGLIFGKQNKSNAPAIPNNAPSSAAEPLETTRSAPRRAKSYDRSILGRNLAPANDTTNSTAQEANTLAGPFDGRRIRNLFNRGKANNPNNNNNQQQSTIAAATPPTTRGFFQRKGSDGSNNSNNGNAERKVAGKNSNPFDDDSSSKFTNEAIGNADILEEGRQGGGGDVNVALII